MMKNKITVWMALLIMASCAGAVQLSAGPSKLIFKDAMQGETLDATITLGTSGADTLSVTLTPDGSIKDWVSFSPLGNLKMVDGSFVMPPNLPVHIKTMVKLPDAVEKGVYDGRININVEPLSAAGGGVGVSIRTGMRLRVIINVTNQPNPKIRIVDVTVPDTREKQPIEFELTAVNEGNVGLESTLMVKISDMEDNALKSYRYNLDMPRIKGDQMFLLKVPSEGLGPGHYIMNVTISVENSPFWTQSSNFSVTRKVRFELAALSSMTTVPSRLPFLMGVAKEKSNYVLYAIPAVLLIIVFVAIMLIRSKKTKGKAM